ncbi:hypothetical protein D1007_53543 [Hordeum vulgare]|nr:hypothetical protein D1007_53543 [Hordeum vulgare]
MARGRGKEKEEKEMERIWLGELRRIERIYDKEMKTISVGESRMGMDWIRKFRKLNALFGDTIVDSEDMNLVRKFCKVERKYREEMEIRSRKDMGGPPILFPIRRGRFPIRPCLVPEELIP